MIEGHIADHGEASENKVIYVTKKERPGKAQPLCVCPLSL
jgi:hypothetical protein